MSLKLMCNHLNVYLQYILPQHFLSRLAGRIAECRIPWIKDLLINQYIKLYKIDMADAEISDPSAYPNFNSFFIRKLKPGARPIVADNNAIASPVDGSLMEIGQIKQAQQINAKNFQFELLGLLGGNKNIAQLFANGLYATLYLAPHNYHRVHMPVSGTLEKTIYIPGKLFSVNPRTAACVPQLYSRNERLVCLFRTAVGPVAVILVGAMIVGSIQTIWMKQPIRGRHILEENFPQGIELAKGDELGYFKLGSTVILLLQAGDATWFLKKDSTVRMGQQIGNFLQNKTSDLSYS